MSSGASHLPTHSAHRRLTTAGDLAYVMWTFDASWTEAGESVVAQGKGITLFRREPDGSWRMSRNAWNANPQEARANICPTPLPACTQP